MRTKGKQTLTNETETMFMQIKTAFDRSQDTLVQDAAGVVALAVMLVVALHLPMFA